MRDTDTTASQAAHAALIYQRLGAKVVPEKSSNYYTGAILDPVLDLFKEYGYHIDSRSMACPVAGTGGIPDMVSVWWVEGSSQPIPRELESLTNNFSRDFHFAEGVPREAGRTDLGPLVAGQTEQNIRQAIATLADVEAYRNQHGLVPSDGRYIHLLARWQVELAEALSKAA